MSDSTTPWTIVHQAPLSSISQFAQIHIHWVRDDLKISSSATPFLCFQSCPASGSFPQKEENELALHIRWPNDWSFSFSSSSEYSGLNSFRTDWFDLCAVQGAHLQHNSKALSALSFLYSPTLPYMTTGKTTALTPQTFVSKVSMLFNMLSRFVIAFLPRSKCLDMVAVTICSDFGAQENKPCHCFHFVPFYLSWSNRNGCHANFFNVEFQASFFNLPFSPSSKGFSSSLYTKNHLMWFFLRLAYMYIYLQLCVYIYKLLGSVYQKASVQ